MPDPLDVSAHTLVPRSIPDSQNYLHSNYESSLPWVFDVRVDSIRLYKRRDHEPQSR